MFRSDIEDAALKLLKDANVFSFPIDLDKVVQYLNIQIVYDDLEDEVSGLLVADGNKRAVVLINKSHHYNRQRFTIAHEIGHFVLHVKNTREETIFVDKKYSFQRDAKSSLGIYQQEKEANAFASNLLMPASMMDEAIAEINLNILDDFCVPILAKKIGVSEQALGFRLESLGYQVGQG